MGQVWFSRIWITFSQYDLEKEKARLYDLEHELMPKLEKEHAEYLDPDWEPNEDWWGSQVTID